MPKKIQKNPKYPISQKYNNKKIITKIREKSKKNPQKPKKSRFVLFLYRHFGGQIS